MINFLYLAIFFYVIAGLAYKLHIAMNKIASSSNNPFLRSLYDLETVSTTGSFYKMAIYSAMSGSIFFIIFIVDYFNLYHYLPSFLLIQ